MPRLSNFTDRQKAELFVRDRATCGYTGKSLWLLDYGADPYFDPDWADHVVPVAKGGQSALANGVSACWSANREKRDSTGDKHACLFLGGKPTPAYFRAHTLGGSENARKVLPPELRQQVERFSRLHYSDWFFNRALFRLLLGIAYLSEKGCTRTRDDVYYARAGLRVRLAWERLARRHAVPALEERGLSPKRPSADQSIMLSIRDQTSADGIRSLMRRLLPIYSAKL
jgi:hypothetical protein